MVFMLQYLLYLDMYLVYNNTFIFPLQSLRLNQLWTVLLCALSFM